MRKRMLAAFTVMLIFVSLTACGGTDGTKAGSTQEESTEKVRYIYGETAIPDISCGNINYEGKADVNPEGDQSVKLQQALDCVVFETHSFGDYTVSLVGDRVRTDEVNFPGSIYTTNLRVEVEKNGVIIEEDGRYNDTVVDILWEYRLFADKIGNYLDVYDLDFPVIAMRYYFDEDPERTVMSAVDFAVIQDDELLYGFVGVFEEGLGVELNSESSDEPAAMLVQAGGVCRVGIFSSDEFVAADGNTLVDEKAGIRYIFDFSDPLPFELYTVERMK